MLLFLSVFTEYLFTILECFNEKKQVLLERRIARRVSSCFSLLPLFKRIRFN